MTERWLIDPSQIATRPPALKFPRMESFIWTQRKADLIRLYLDLFVKITFRGTYIDAFAGPQDLEDAWAARKLWEMNPGQGKRRIDRFELFELNKTSFKKLENMVEGTPPDGRKVFLKRGDSNLSIPAMLSARPIKDPAFCLLDQRSTECDWALVRTLAEHKNDGHKVELFYFLMAGWKDRCVKNLTKNRNSVLTNWWGRADIDTPEKADVFRLAEIFTERFQKELGYRFAQPYQIRDSFTATGKLQYFMIHASDHAEAPMFMRRAFKKVAALRDDIVEQTHLNWSEGEVEEILKEGSAKQTASETPQ